MKLRSLTFTNIKFLRKFSSEASPHPYTQSARDGNVQLGTKPRILITGSHGQLGYGVAQALRKSYGRENVIMSDIIKPSKRILESGPYIHADILDFKNLQQVVVTHRLDWLIHFSALLSAVGEKNLSLAMKVNVEGVHNILELSRQFGLRLFVPSTIGAFGPESPRNPTPNLTVQRPKTIYGVSKVHAELLGEYFHHRYGLDFRCLRFPGVISYDTNPGGGTTDYAVQIFHDALTTRHHVCYLRKDTRLPMMYITDTIKSICEFMALDSSVLPQRTYNVTAMSFTPEEIADSIRRHIPSLEVTYKPDDRQKIADSWPQVFDDSEARTEWGWEHEYDLDKLVDIMITSLRPKYAS
ncbi:L-threonine 3-dehydrogenase, mitochondrial-like [Artemia franciscana]|uniref:L-threonine 3-dehydrogenase, mitochondrial n=1 Tax=Artemia franciscana TaxID=6661 RepID=A0AA88I8B3_ARTSF|nr:hypothetical protein QYM36_002651 [Artemia franciscana]